MGRGQVRGQGAGLGGLVVVGCVSQGKFSGEGGLGGPQVKVSARGSMAVLMPGEVCPWGRE